MVTAILAGAKTQTRRVLKKTSCTCGNPPGSADHQLENIECNQWACASLGYTGDFVRCPYGAVGDRLYVRETWQPFRDHTPEQQAKISAWFAKGNYSNFMNEVEAWAPLPDGEVRAMYAADFGDWAHHVDSDLKPWKPSIHMPRWASRLLLEITSVKVERLNDITEEDAKAEGVEARVPDNVQTDMRYRAPFKCLWDKINGKRPGCSWADNPWVWVVEFSKAEVANA